MSTRIELIANEVFVDPEKAARWLQRPLPILGHRSPLEVSSTPAGVALIEGILAKIDWGAAA